MARCTYQPAPLCRQQIFDFGLLGLGQEFGISVITLFCTGLKSDKMEYY